jgi:hypothetical protein
MLSINNNSTLLKPMREGSGISYYQQLNTMLCCKPLFTGKGFFYMLSDVGLQVATKELAFDFATNTVNEPTTYRKASPIKPTTKVWSKLAHDYPLTDRVRELFKLMKINELTLDEHESVIEGLILNYEVRDKSNESGAA